MTPHESDLRSVLADDAEHIDATGDFASAAITLEKRRARRRAGVTTAAVAAAAVAVAVPFLLTGTGPNRGTPVPGTTAPSNVTTSSPSASTDATATSSAPTSTDSATTGTPAPPPVVNRDAWALDDKLFHDGRTIGLERGTVVEHFAVLANGGFILTSHVGDGASETELLDSTGHTVKELPEVRGWQISRSGSTIVYRVGDEVRVIDDTGDVQARMSSTLDPAAIVGTNVYLSGPKASLRWDIETGRTQQLNAHLAAVSADQTRAALEWAADAPNEGIDVGCWAVVDLTRDTVPPPVLFEHCRDENKEYFLPGQFTPDGKTVIGQSYIDGGHYFLYTGMRVTDGSLVYGGYGNGTPAAPGWGQRASADGTILLSLNDSHPLYPVTHSKVVRCTLAMECRDVAPRVPVDELGQRHYVIAR